jgi:hypothetical protein
MPILPDDAQFLNRSTRMHQGNRCKVSHHDEPKQLLMVEGAVYIKHDPEHWPGNASLNTAFRHASARPPHDCHDETPILLA